MHSSIFTIQHHVSMALFAVSPSLFIFPPLNTLHLIFFSRSQFSLRSQLFSLSRSLKTTQRWRWCRYEYSPSLLAVSEKCLNSLLCFTSPLHFLLLFLPSHSSILSVLFTYILNIILFCPLSEYFSPPVLEEVEALLRLRLLTLLSFVFCLHLPL